MSTLEGTDQLTKALLQLPIDVGNKVLRGSALAGAKVVRDAVRALAPVAAGPVKRKGGVITSPGTLKRAVVLKFAREKSSNTQQSYVVAVRHGKRFQKGNRDAFYWLWVEQGHRVVSRGGRRRGTVIGEAAPHPFYVPGYRATYAQALAAMKAKAEAGIAAIATGRA